MERHYFKFLKPLGLWIHTLLHNPLEALRPRTLREYVKAMGKFIFIWAGSVIIGIGSFFTEVIGIPITDTKRLWMQVACFVVVAVAPIFAFGKILKRVDCLEATNQSQLDALIEIRKDIEGQLKYLVSPNQARIVSVTAGATILRGIDTLHIFDAPKHEKLKTRVEALRNRSYPWQTTHKTLSNEYCVFIGFISVIEQQPDNDFARNPDIHPTVQRIEIGIRALVKEIDSAIEDLKARQSH